METTVGSAICFTSTLNLLLKTADGIVVPRSCQNFERTNDRVEVARAVSASVSGAWIAGRSTERIIPVPRASIPWKMIHSAEKNGH
jgi:hypothetical protein